VENKEMDEAMDEAMSECIKMVIAEGKTQEEAVAICYSKRERGELEGKPIIEAPEVVLNPAEPKPPKGKIEILADIKKLFEKNGYEISDEKLFELFESVSETDTIVKKFSLDIHEATGGYEIKVFPKKKIYLEKYDQSIDFDSKLFKEMIDNFKNDKLFRPYVDLEHKLGEKYADILDLYERDDGLYALISLNENGKELIKGNRYSYISPEWGDRVGTDKHLHKNVLWAITLTNVPALEGELPKLQDQIKLQKGGKMNIKEKLLKLEGKISNYRLQEEPAILPPELMEAIQLLNEAMTKINELTTQKDVAEEKAEELMGKLTKIETETTELEKENFFKDVVASGQVDMKELDDWKLQYDKSKDFVKKILTAKPKKDDVMLSATVPTSNTKLSNEDTKIMKQFAMTEEQYRKNVLGEK